MASNLQSARDFDSYAKGVTVDELRRVRRQLAKVMNQRMVRLENTKSAVSGESYAYGAHDVMQDYLESQGRPGKDGRRRFDERLKAADDTKDFKKSQLQKEIKILQKFEDMESSRVAGQKAIERRRISTFMEDKRSDNKVLRQALHEDTVNRKEFYDFLNSATYDELIRSGLNSDDIVEEYDRAADRGVSHERIAKELESWKNKTKKLSVKGLRKTLRSRKLK